MMLTGGLNIGLQIVTYTKLQRIIDDDRIHITDVSTIITDLSTLSIKSLLIT